MLGYLWLEAKRQWRNRDALIFRLGLPTGVYLILTLAQQDPAGESSMGVPRATARMAAAAGCGNCAPLRCAPAWRWRPRSRWR
jgi:hypothetical protein